MHFRTSDVLTGNKMQHLVNEQFDLKFPAACEDFQGCDWRIPELIRGMCEDVEAFIQMIYVKLFCFYVYFNTGCNFF